MANGLTDAAREALAGKGYWHLATLNPDGGPQVSTVWTDLRDGLLIVSSLSGRQKTRNIERDPRVALSWHDPQNPHHAISIQGRVVDRYTGEKAVDDIIGLTRKYLAGEASAKTIAALEAERGNVSRVTFLIEAIRVHEYRSPRLAQQDDDKREAAMTVYPDTVQRLADLEAIRDLGRRYCHHVWQREPSSVAELFAEDGSFIALLADRTIEQHGREAVRSVYAAFDAVGGPGPYPFIHNHVVEFQSADRARGTCYLDGRSMGPNGEIVLYAGFYADEYVRVADSWYFQERRFRTLIPNAVIHDPAADA